MKTVLLFFFILTATLSFSQPTSSKIDLSTAFDPLFEKFPSRFVRQSSPDQNPNETIYRSYPGR